MIKASSYGKSTKTEFKRENSANILLGNIFELMFCEFYSFEYKYFSTVAALACSIHIHSLCHSVAAMMIMMIMMTMMIMIIRNQCCTFGVVK